MIGLKFKVLKLALPNIANISTEARCTFLQTFLVFLSAVSRLFLQ